MTEQKDLKPVAIFLYSGEFDKVHYALTVAFAAVSANRPTTLLVTMGACKAFAFRYDKTKRWNTLPLSESTDSIAVTTPKELNSYYRSQDIPMFEPLLNDCIRQGAKFLMCDMGLRAMGIIEEELFPECKFIITPLSQFLQDAQGSDIISI
ncbi:MAG: DsrE/DsrF-like family protein [Rickettsiales bacterium]|jgi:peroxiredoxin family protein|nr:DsrE/DsrF-like family protein [Rickettsiales bacterium]